ncbi:uncharacterized protein A4U43_C05F3720 [Asparagus officinalis]|uniref:Protein kinase domain-containing protein n=1 Tax=Asparagus officinalis TaxID=4686 RepID=A0A5P1EP50_ASPOF|nr:receptor-like protein kinase THESEUS 1 [Asparagus officinalis]ONK67782.1 uncharacterized protein A4U43_C05F3720 [Asparagus officinalis]
MNPKTHIPIFFIALILTLNSINGTFTPQDNFLLNCGGNSALKLEDGRIFQPDKNPGSSSFFLLTPASHNVVYSDTKPLDLYGSARVFTQATDYSFKIQQKGRHFLRLHFYPVSSPIYNLKDATFTVGANGFTFLYDFSYSKLGLDQSVVLKEYIVDLGLDSKPLVVNLVPSSGSIAFVNGIEVISLPDRVFPATGSSISENEPVEISGNIAFETLHRINMGGPYVSSKNDGLWRDWKPDGKFLINSASAIAISTDPDSIKYSSRVSVDTAPNLVYATAQEMADANVGNQRFNISWVFDVDSGFRYLIRLHFCDILSHNVGNLLFNVYINNQSALSSFDISHKANGLSTACFVDFIVEVQIEKILIQIGPPQITSSLPNAILNGLEILKFSNSKGSLDRSQGENPIGVKVKKDKNKNNLLAIVIVSFLGGAILLAILIAAFVLYFRHRKKTRDESGGSTWLPSPMAVHTHTGNSETKISLGSFASSGPSLSFSRLLAFMEIKEATKNFDESLVLGVGGFGKVYKGVLENGLVVAVKRGNPGSQQGLIEFRTEIEMLSKLRHRHLVSLIGFCHEPNEMVLVYDFMAGGPLRRHLYGSNLPCLSWKQRLEICIGAAKGLHYLHTGAEETIIHRDVKTTNILLDENLTAKVSDFGLSKLGPTVDQTHVSTAVKGSFGYLDPEYFRRQQLTEKSDVYSFGVVLLEVLCARPAINPSLPREQINIVEWAMSWQKKGQLERAIDPHLVGTVSLNSLRKFGEAAEKCLADYGAERPTMGDVLWNLEYALQLQESFMKNVGDESSMNEIKDIPDWIQEIGDSNHDSFSVVSSGTDVPTSRVFSQLMDPRGR